MRNISPPLGTRDITYLSLLSMSLPPSLAAISTPLAGLVSTATIGHVGDSALIGGVAAANVLISLVFFTFNFLRSSTTALVSQAFGAGRQDEILSTTLRAVVVALVIGGLGLCLKRPIAQFGLALLGLSPDVHTAADAYFGLRVWSTPLLLVHYAIVGWLFGTGRMVTGMVLEGLLNSLNAGLTVGFVVGLDLGVGGAAIATALSEVLTAVAGIILFLRAGSRKWAGIVQGLWSQKQFRQLVAINADMLIRSLMLFSAIAFFTRQSAEFGATVLAANVILMNLFYFSGAVIQGVAVAAQSLVGLSFGWGDKRFFDKAVGMTLLSSLVTGAVISLFYAGIRNVFLDFMTADAVLRAAVHDDYIWAVLTAPIGCLAFVMDGIFIGATWSRDIRNMMAFSILLFAVLSLSLPIFFGNDGLWIAFLAFLLARGLSLYFRLVVLRRRYGLFRDNR